PNIGSFPMPTSQIPISRPFGIPRGTASDSLLDSLSEVSTMSPNTRPPCPRSEQKCGAREKTLLPPHLVRHIDRELELCPLLLLGKEVAFLGRGKAALRRYRELLQRHEFTCLFQPPLDVVLVLELAEFRRDDADHHDLVAVRQEAQGLEATGAVGIIFEEIAIVMGVPQHGFRHRLVAAGGNPGGAEIAAADMRGDHHVGGPLRYRVVDDAGVDLL